MKFNDFFKPRWKHSDPKIRLEAIKELVPEYNLKDLTLIAIEDSQLENKKLALRKISNEEALVQIAEKAGDQGIQDSARKKLNEIWTKQIGDAKNEGESIVILEKISDNKCLEELALSSKSSTIREKCLGRLTHPNSFYRVALKENVSNLALQAFERVNKSVHFETLAKKANCKAVRVKAKEKIISEQNSGPKQSEEEVNSAKLELLIKTVEGAVNTQNWESAATTVKDAEETWSSLEGHGQLNGIAARFTTASKDFWDKYNTHMAKEREKKETEKSLKEHMAVKLEICESFDRLLNMKTTDERILEIESLIKRWNSIKESFSEAQSLDQRFRAALATYKRDYQKEAEQITALTEAAQIQESLEKIRELKSVSKMKSVLESSTNKWRAISEKISEEQELKFNELVRSANDAMEEAKEKEKENQVQALSKMKELLPQLEKLNDDPDLVSTEKTFRDLNMTWKNLDPGHYAHPELEMSFEEVRQSFLEITNRYKEAQEWLRWANLKKKQEICDKLKTALDNEADERQLFEKLKEARGEWKAIGPVSWDSSKEIWDTYQKLLDDIYEKCQSVISELAEEKQANLDQKKGLITKVESFLETDNWKEASDSVKAAQDEWKNVGPVPREESETVWEAFRKACDEFFSKRREHYESLEKDKDSNLSKKIELCELVEKHKEDTNWKEATEIFKKAQEDWKNTGPVPKEKVEELWTRFRSACDFFFNAREAFFKEMVANKAENLIKKTALCEKMEALDQLDESEDKFEIIKQAQAEWKAIGPVEKDKVEELWERFRKPIDAFFDDRKKRFEEEKVVREENLVKKQELCEQAEEVSKSSNWKETSEKLKALQAQWKEIGPAPRKQDKEIWNRFRGACDDFFARMKEHYKALDDQRELNFRAKEDLCFQAESLAGFEVPEGQDAPTDVNWNEATEQIKEMQKKWKATGPVHKSKSDELWHRFRMACDYVFDLAREAEQESSDREDNYNSKIEICEEAEKISRQAFTDSQIMKVKDLQKEWKSIGPLEIPQHKELWVRFKKACDEVYAQDIRTQD